MTEPIIDTLTGMLLALIAGLWLVLTWLQHNGPLK